MPGRRAPGPERNYVIAGDKIMTRRCNVAKVCHLLLCKQSSVWPWSEHKGRTLLGFMQFGGGGSLMSVLDWDLLLTGLCDELLKGSLTGLGVLTIRGGGTGCSQEVSWGESLFCGSVTERGNVAGVNRPNKHNHANNKVWKSTNERVHTKKRPTEYKDFQRHVFIFTNQSFFLNPLTFKDAQGPVECRLIK